MFSQKYMKSEKIEKIYKGIINLFSSFDFAIIINQL